MINWYSYMYMYTFISASVKTLEFLNTQYCNCFRIIIYLKPWNPIMFESGLYFTRPSFVVVYMSTVYKKCNGWKKILRNIGFKTNLFILRHWSVFESSWNDVWFLSCLFISFLCMVVFFYLTYYFCVFI